MLTDGKRFKTSWRDMKARCDNPLLSSYKNYGGRGITYQQSWSYFYNFAFDMQSSWFPGATIDRVDVNGNYTKENCKWIKREEQTVTGKLRIRSTNTLGIAGVEKLANEVFRVLVREQGYVRNQGPKRVLYRGKDFFEACCRRKAWENTVRVR